MIHKKYTAYTEAEAVLMAKKELGDDAIVTNVKKKTPKGIFKLFRKPTVEITVMLDETPPASSEISRKESLKAVFKDNPDIIFDEPEKAEGKKPFVAPRAEEASALEQRLSSLTAILEEQIKGSSVPQKPGSDKQAEELKNTEEADKSISCIQLIYNQLADNEVDERYINQIVSEVEPTLKKDASVDTILAAIYQKIVLKLGKTEVLDVGPGKKKFVFFIGPTGVGKTTTIAKIASKLKLEKKLDIALLTSDTYRIAAVEQLQTYASILQVPLQVVYNESEMNAAMETLKSHEIVLVDTAGRSHKDKGQKRDIENLINSIPEDQREVFLVLSVTTKYKDLVKITEAYSEITNYKLIFTKLDETTCLGNIYNIKQLTGAPLSYATFGQNVPDDISKIDAQKIANGLLGGGM